MSLSSSLLSRQLAEEVTLPGPVRRRFGPATVAAACLSGCAVLLFAPRGATTGPLPPVAESAAAGQAVPKYTRAQFLGFNLFTAPGTSADGCFGDDASVEGSCYLGSDEVSEDVNRRFDIMLEAIESAFASEHLDRSPTTLKVFTAPEFYWRGPHGAYRPDRPGTVQVLNKIEQVVLATLSDPRFNDWLFMTGTVVAAMPADPRFVHMSNLPFQNISYYNFANIHVGGSKRHLLVFKHFISSIDFLKASPETLRHDFVQPPPGMSHEFCKLHPDSNGCLYDTPPLELLEKFGLNSSVILKDGIFEVGGVKIGAEICLDHAKGALCEALGPDGTVDLQLVVSAGMNIATGPVCTKAGSPVFLSDGFARTELSLNGFGGGRNSMEVPSGGRRYNVGIVYGADAIVGLQQWIADAIDAVTGTGFGTRFAGEGTLPGGSVASGETGIIFRQISALGPDWRQTLKGFYNTGSYHLASKVDMRLEDELNTYLRRKHRNLTESIEPVVIAPTIDMYGPLPIWKS